LVLWCMRA